MAVLNLGVLKSELMMAVVVAGYCLMVTEVFLKAGK
jgi:hypothetical protein